MTLARSFKYWRNKLFEKSCRLFEWENLPFPQKEIETRLLIHGFCGFVDDKKKGLMVATGSLSGNTQYYDIFKNFTFASPTANGGTFEIGKKCVVIDNDSLRNGMLDLVDRYALMLAHCEISTKMVLVNMRYKDVLVADNSQSAESVNAFYRSLIDGKEGSILDKSLFEKGVFSAGATSNMPDVRTLWETRNDILRSFYQEIGINYTKEKKERQITDELNGDTQLLLLNVDDMLKCRMKACDEINEMFGLNVSVRLVNNIENGESEVLADDDN